MKILGECNRGWFGRSWTGGEYEQDICMYKNFVYKTITLKTKYH